jgi:hypothetical protein
MNRTSRLTAVVLVVVVVVASPALPQTGLGEAPRTFSFGETLRGFTPSFLLKLWDDLGCSADPLGGLTSVHADEGCSIDPFGLCLQGGVTDAGY